MLPVVVSTDHSTTEDVDWHSAVGYGGAEDTDHDSTDWAVLGTSTGSLAEGWYMDEYCS